MISDSDYDFIVRNGHFLDRYYFENIVIDFYRANNIYQLYKNSSIYFLPKNIVLDGNECQYCIDNVNNITWNMAFIYLQFNQEQLDILLRSLSVNDCYNAFQCQTINEDIIEKYFDKFEDMLPHIILSNKFSTTFIKKHNKIFKKYPYQTFISQQFYDLNHAKTFLRLASNIYDPTSIICKYAQLAYLEKFGYTVFDNPTQEAKDYIKVTKEL